MMIINKLEDSDIYDLLDADVVLSNNILTLNRRVKENKNTVQARKLNLESDFFLDYNAKITNKTKKEYKLYYQNELQNRQLSLDLFMNSLKYSVKLKEEIGIYLEQKIKDLCDQDKEIFRIYLNESIVDSADSVMFIDDYIDQVDNKIEIYKHYRDCTCISKTRKN